MICARRNQPKKKGKGLSITIEVGGAIAVRQSGISIIGRVIKKDGDNITVMTPFGNSIEVISGLTFRPTKEEEEELERHERRASNHRKAYPNALKREGERWKAINQPAGQA